MGSRKNRSSSARYFIISRKKCFFKVNLNCKKKEHSWAIFADADYFMC